MATKSITTQALHRRVNRALAHHGQVLRKCREDSRYYHDKGDYYLVNLETAGIDETYIDLEELARELKVIENVEVVADSTGDSRPSNPELSEKEFLARARQMRKEYRVMERRLNDLIKKDKYGDLDKKEQKELDQLFKDCAKKAAENVQDLLRMGPRISEKHK